MSPHRDSAGIGLRYPLQYGSQQRHRILDIAVPGIRVTLRAIEAEGSDKQPLRAVRGDDLDPIGCQGSLVKKMIAARPPTPAVGHDQDGKELIRWMRRDAHGSIMARTLDEVRYDQRPATVPLSLLPFHLNLLDPDVRASPLLFNGPALRLRRRGEEAIQQRLRRGHG